MSRPNLTGLWMVPYADLMSTLVILFLALFAYSYGTNKSAEYDVAVTHLRTELSSTNKEAGTSQAELKEAELALNLKKEMKGLKLEDFGLLINSRRIQLVLPTPVLF